MLTLIVSATVMGFIGSVHCLGMCGPLMLYHFPKLNNQKAWANFVLYHIARIIAYVMIGVMFGQIGWIAKFFGLQQFISIATGLFIILWSISYVVPLKKITPGFQFNLFNYVGLNKLNNVSSALKFGVAGLINGFLPCGFSFVAFMIAMNFQSPLHASLFMLFFGIATIPALALISILSTKTIANQKLVKIKLLPLIALITGSILVVRSLNLGIPYLSPKIEYNQAKTKVKCH